MKNNNIKNISLWLFIIGISFQGNTQTEVAPAEEIEIVGSNTVSINDVETYSAFSTNVKDASWSVSGGSIQSQDKYSADIKWTTQGSHEITYRYNKSGGDDPNILQAQEGRYYYIYYGVTVRGNIVAPNTPPAPTLAIQNCNSAILQKTGNIPYGENWYWQGTNSNGTSTSQSATSNYTVNATGTYYIRSKSNNGLWSDSSSKYIALGTAGGATWYADTDGDGKGDPNVSQTACIQPTGYVSNNNDACPNEHGQGSADGCLNSNNENYIYTLVPQVPVTAITSLNNDDDVIESYQYFDGLGRPKQNVAIRAGGDKEDIITHIGYDEFGRQAKEYLPYAATSNGGVFRKGNIELTTQIFYKSKYPNDFLNTLTADVNPYSQKVFENSPLNRVQEQAAPGKDWKAGNGHTIKFEYQTNTTNEVKMYGVTLNSAYTPTLTGGTAYYGAGQLYKTITKDENWRTSDNKDKTTEEFKNKQGQVILKRTYNNQQPHDTYYVYDDFGNLTYVLPPKASSLDLTLANSDVPADVISSAVITSGNTLHLRATNSITLAPGFDAQLGSTFWAEIISQDSDVTDKVLEKLCYQYKYDYRNRLIEKKIPGKEWEYIVYDKLDRPVLTQDANLREDKKWLFTKYDVFGRVVYTGMYSHNVILTQKQMQTHFDTAPTQTGERKLYETKSNSEFGSSYVWHYYTNYQFPYRNIEILTVNYYDNYTFNRAGSSIAVYAYETFSTSSTKGLITGNKTKVLETDHWITTVHYYDEKARPIYTYSKNDYLKTTDIVETQLDFVGKVLANRATHKKKRQKNIVIRDKFTYDHVGRLLTHKQRIKGRDNKKELITKNHYDELGQLIKKDVGGTEKAPLQEVDYAYNVRGWLKNINDDANNDHDLFNFTLQYNNPINGTALYNGNISQTSWKTANDNTKRYYNYRYDDLNRITNANYYGENQNSRFNLGNISYDKNGNIQRLYRSGAIVENPDVEEASHYSTMDYLYYTYDGNQLEKVLDNGNDNYGFKDGVNLDIEYTYDANGNMITDANKGITAISYNHLNLPTEVQFGITDKIQYLYDATGIKLEKVVKDNGNIITTQYAGNYIYKDNVLEFFNTPEGYATPVISSDSDAISSFNYVYQYKDHLGNVRLSYKKLDQELTLTNDTFTGSTNSWYGSGSTVTHQSGKLKVNSTALWSSAKKLLERKVREGDQITGRIYIDKGTTTAVALGISKFENDTYKGIDNIMEFTQGWNTFKYTVPEGINTLEFKVYKSVNDGVATYYYIDNFKLTLNDLEIIEEKNYYPFGLQHKGYNNTINPNGNSVAQKFGFGGKELSEELGINWHDFDARNYDAALGRWMNIDPLAEQMYSHSPYSYAFNNPIYFFDMDGNIPLPQIINYIRESSPFGIRMHPIKKKLIGHSGGDYTAPAGSNIRSAARGKVEKVGWDPNGYGRYIVIKHADGYYTLYAHLEKYGSLVTKGDNISNGQLIGTSGNTGGSTGPHLHFEIIKSNSSAGIFNKSNKVNPNSIYDLDVQLHGVFGPQTKSDHDKSKESSSLLAGRDLVKCVDCTLHTEPVSPTLRPTVTSLPSITPGGVTPVNPSPVIPTSPLIPGIPKPFVPVFVIPTPKVD